VKASQCHVGQHVRDTRTGIAYRVTELRLLATDSGAWVFALDPATDLAYQQGLIAFGDLEPIDTPEDETP
jgi:hypothetical protein